jgi:hypothetical protein
MFGDVPERDHDILDTSWRLAVSRPLWLSHPTEVHL